MTFLFGWVIAVVGMFTLALTQSKQSKLLLAGGLPQRFRLPLIGIGSALLGLSAYQAVFAYGLGVGLVTFFFHACFAAWFVSLMLTWRRSLT